MTDEIKNEQEQGNKKGLKRKRVIIPAILSIIIILAGIYFYYKSTTFISTDDAYVEGHIIQISPKVSGYVTKVFIDDNQRVKKGQLLVEIDKADYQVQYDKAKAKLDTVIEKQKGASINVDLTSITSGSVSGQAKAALEQVSHAVSSARAEMALAQTEFERYTKLYQNGIVSKQELDKVTTRHKVAKESLNEALKSFDQAAEKSKGANTVDKQVAITTSQLKATDAETRQLQAEAKQAELNLSYTKINAVTSGIITNKSVEEGAYIQTGQPLFTIVPEERWIVANFKETQLTNIKPGQAVLIKIDTYPNKKFKGVVDSIQESTGAKSSLFPPENAVGSFVKVVQRVPVKIIFTEKIDSKYVIVPGMSVIPEVKVK